MHHLPAFLETFLDEFDKQRAFAIKVLLDFIIVLICSSLHDDKIDLHDSESTFEPLQLLIVD